MAFCFLRRSLYSTAAGSRVHLPPNMSGDDTWKDKIIRLVAVIGQQTWGWLPPPRPSSQQVSSYDSCDTLDACALFGRRAWRTSGARPPFPSQSP